MYDSKEEIKTGGNCSLRFFVVNPKHKGGKMAKSTEWKEAKTGSYNPLFKFDKKGAEIQGVFRGSRFVEKTSSTIHTIETADGEVDFWGCGKLDFLLKEIAPGTEVRIVYQGMISAKVKIGKKNVTKDIHDYKLFTR